MSANTDYIVLLSEKFPVVLYDGTCRFCNYWVQFILKRDTSQEFRFLALESEPGILVIKQIAPKHEKTDTIIVLYRNRVFAFADAVYIILEKLHHPARFLWFVFPPFLRDGTYRFVAKYRHKISFFQKECILLSEKQKQQFLSETG